MLQPTTRQSTPPRPANQNATVDSTHEQIPTGMEAAGPSSRRCSLRAAVQLTGEDLHGATAAYTANVSESGMFVALQNPPPVGSWLLFEMVLSADPADRVRGMGTVAWTRSQTATRNQPDGMGFEFRFLSRDGSERIAASIDSTRKVQQTPPRPATTQSHVQRSAKPTPLDLLHAYRSTAAA